MAVLQAAGHALCAVLVAPARRLWRHLKKLARLRELQAECHVTANMFNCHTPDVSKTYRPVTANTPRKLAQISFFRCTN
jgi:hypothetical protein